MKKSTPSDKQQSPYLTYLLHFNTSSLAKLCHSIPDESRQTDQNLSTQLHNPDHINQFEIKISPSDKQHKPYPFFLSYQPV